MILFAELPQIDKILEDFARSGYDWKNTRAALRNAAEYGIGIWQEILSKPKEKHSVYFTRKYASGLQVLGEQNRSIKFGVSEKMTGFAKVVEEGREPYPIWRGMAKSPRLRRGKNGPYMIVAFRHGMAQVEQHGLGDQFSKLKSYQKVGERTGVNADGHSVQRNVYSFSSEGFGKKIGLSAATHPALPGHKSHIMDGLTKTSQPTKGGGAHNSAITFRIITANSKGWIFPRISAQNVRKQVIDKMVGDPRFLEIIRQGVAADMIASKGL